MRIFCNRCGSPMEAGGVCPKCGNGVRAITGQQQVELTKTNQSKLEKYFPYFVLGGVFVCLLITFLAPFAEVYEVYWYDNNHEESSRICSLISACPQVFGLFFLLFLFELIGIAVFTMVFKKMEKLALSISIGLTYLSTAILVLTAMLEDVSLTGIEMLIVIAAVLFVSTVVLLTCLYKLRKFTALLPVLFLPVLLWFDSYPRWLIYQGFLILLPFAFIAVAIILNRPKFSRKMLSGIAAVAAALLYTILQCIFGIINEMGITGGVTIYENDRIYDAIFPCFFINICWYISLVMLQFYFVPVSKKIKAKKAA